MNKQIKRHLLSPILIRVLTVSLNFISNILINRSLGLALKGQYTIIINYANFLQLLLNFGICYAYASFVKNGNKKGAQALVSLIWMQAGIVSVLAGVVAFISNKPSSLLIVVLAVVLIVNSQFVFMALIDNIQRRNIILLISTVIYIVLNSVGIIVASGNLYLVIVFLIVKYVFEILVCCKKYQYFSFNLKIIDKDILVEIFKVGIPTALLSVLITCSYNLDILMLNWLGAGNVQVGIYGVAYSLSNMLWIVPDAFKEMIYNRTVHENTYNYILKYIGINMIGCLVICLSFLIFGKAFLGFVYGEEYKVAYNVSLTLFVGIIPMVAFKLIHPIYVNNGKSLVAVVLLLFTILANIIADYILIPIHGAFGAAIASIITYSICGGLFFIKFYLDYCIKHM